MGFLNWVKGVDHKLEPEALESQHTVPTADDILQALNKTADMVHRANLSGVVIARVDRVSKAVRDVMPLLEREGLGSQDSYAIMATATDYLPEALGAYLRLPREWADSRPVDRGRTALMLLIDQLDLLTATMDKILDAVARADATALVAHGRFLNARFGGQAGAGDLELGEDAGTPPPEPSDTDAPAPATPSERGDTDAHPGPPAQRSTPADSSPAPRNPLDLDF